MKLAMDDKSNKSKIYTDATKFFSEINDNIWDATFKVNNVKFLWFIGAWWA